VAAIEEVERDVSGYELEMMMSGPYDDCDCRVEVQAGAGGDDAQDWAAM
jgi:peptide chain release factor 2